MKRFTDIHTHNPAAGADAVICVDPVEQPMGELRPDRFYSAGIHPWNAAKADEAAMQALERLVGLPNVVAVGEAGLDKLRGPGLDVQQQVFVSQARLAEQARKPLVIHAVRAWAELLRLKRLIKPEQPWIIHGFRGNPELARQLVDHGFHISLGRRRHPGVEAVVPPAMLHYETDDMPQNIHPAPAAEPKRDE